MLTYNGSDLRLVSPSSDFATASTMHAIRNNATDDVVLRSTNGGVTWDVTSADPFDDSAEDDEAISGSAISQRSANTLVAGGNKGTIAITTDGGSTWTNIDPDPRSSGRVDELDFISGTTVYVVTLENTRGVFTPLLTTDGGATFAEIGDPGNAWGKGGSITYRNETFDGTMGKALVIIKGATSNGIWRYDADAASPKWTKVQSGGNWSSGFSVGAPGIGDGRLLILYDSVREADRPHLLPVHHDHQFRLGCDIAEHGGSGQPRRSGHSPRFQRPHATGHRRQRRAGSGLHPHQRVPEWDKPEESGRRRHSADQPGR